MLVLAAALLSPSAAEAAFPGQNGRIAFSRCAWNQEQLVCSGSTDIWAMNADGSGQVNLTNTAAVTEGRPAWSPDGRRLAFNSLSGGSFRIRIMDADGSNQVLFPVINAKDAEWSPDGRRIAFSHQVGSQGRIYVANVDGSGLTELTNGAHSADEIPQWSPDGGEIIFDRDNVHWIMDADGSNERQLAPATPREVNGPSWAPDGASLVWHSHRDSGFDHNDLYVSTPAITGIRRLNQTGALDLAPDFSPDGSRVVFQSNEDPFFEAEDINVINADGTGEVDLTNSPDQAEGTPDWQPLPVNSYPRPRGAARQHIALVTAYQPCRSPDRTHGPPLVSGSCGSPQMESGEITVGTGDSNGLQAKNKGYLSVAAFPGNPQVPGNDADVRLTLHVDGLYDKTTLEPYTGELKARMSLQITDKSNTPHPGGPGAGTTVGIPLEFSAGCLWGPPPDATSCFAVTELSAMLPGAVQEGRRAIWEIDDVEIWDGGPDDDAQTEPNTLFARQGVFIP